MREYDSVTQAVMGISDRMLSDFEPRGANGTLPIMKERRKIADFEYVIKTTDVGRRKLDFSVRPYAKAGMEQSFNAIMRAAAESKQHYDLSFRAENVRTIGRRDLDLQSGSYSLEGTHLVPLAAVVLGMDQKELEGKIATAGREHNRRAPPEIGAEYVWSTLWGKNGFVNVRYFLAPAGIRTLACPICSSRRMGKLTIRLWLKRF